KQRLWAVARSLVDQPRSTTDGASDGEPRVAAALRTRHRRDTGQRWQARGSTDASRTPGLVGRRFHEEWLDVEAAAPADHDLKRLPAVVSSACRRGNL